MTCQGGLHMSSYDSQDFGKRDIQRCLGRIHFLKAPVRASLERTQVCWRRAGDDAEVRRRPGSYEPSWLGSASRKHKGCTVGKSLRLDDKDSSRSEKSSLGTGSRRHTRSPCSTEIEQESANVLCMYVRFSTYNSAVFLISAAAIVPRIPVGVSMVGRQRTCLVVACHFLELFAEGRGLVLKRQPFPVQFFRRPPDTTAPSVSNQLVDRLDCGW